MSDGPVVGTVLADAPLLDSKGKSTSLSRLAGDRVLVLLVYDGASSPTAIRRLLEFRDATMAFDRLGARIAAVSPDEPSVAAFLKTERGVGFTLACDPGKKALREWGLLDPATGEVRESLFVLGRDRGIRTGSVGELPDADRMLHFIRRGGAKGATRAQPSAPARAGFFARAAAAISQVLRTPGVVR
jgi:peroxiredoxin